MLVADASRPSINATAATPRLYGTGGSGSETFDFSLSRWLPVGHDLVAPSASEYAYSELIPNPANQGLGGPPPLGTKVHLVDVASATDRVIYQTTAVLSAAAFRSEGIYLTQPVDFTDTATAFNVWLLDPTTRSARKLLGGASVGPGNFAVGPGALWVMVPIDVRNPKGHLKLVRVGLNDGTGAVWFEQSTEFAEFLGLDSAGRPIVETSSGANDDPGKTLVLPGAGSMQLITDQEFSEAVADSHGLWLSGNGVWLYPPGGILQKISSESGGWMLGACG